LPEVPSPRVHPLVVEVFGRFGCERRREAALADDYDGLRERHSPEGRSAHAHDDVRRRIGRAWVEESPYEDDDLSAQCLVYGPRCGLQRIASMSVADDDEAERECPPKLSDGFDRPMQAFGLHPLDDA
jgi:hypothetical protein